MSPRIQPLNLLEFAYPLIGNEPSVDAVRLRSERALLGSTLRVSSPNIDEVFYDLN